MKKATPSKQTNQPLAVYPSLELPNLPAVSTLYPLQPIGIGTGMVESLTSYTVRIARVHRVTPGQLFTKLILPLIKELPLESRLGSFNSTFGGYSRFFNGCTKPAEALTDALQKLTFKSDLDLLSMLRWRGAVSSKLLTKKVLAWCPECYNDWAKSGTTLYQPLLWALDIVTICTVHNVNLFTECPSCRRPTPPLEGRLQIGYCPKCGEWLGHLSRQSQEKVDSSRNDLQPEFVSRQVGDLLAASARTMDQDKLATRITAVLRGHRLPNLSSLARAANMHGNYVFDIKYSRGASLPLLLKICQAAETNLKELLCEPAPIQPMYLPTIYRPAFRLRGKWDHAFIDQVRAALEEALTETRPPSVYHIAYTLQSQPQSLRRRFPKLTNRIDLKISRLRKQRAYQIAAVLKQALEENEPPSIASLVKRLGLNRASLYEQFPEEVTQLSARYLAFKSQSSVCRKTAARDAVRQAANQLHDRSEYPSVRKVLAELGWKRSREQDSFVRAILSEVRNALGITEAPFGRKPLNHHST